MQKAGRLRFEQTHSHTGKLKLGQNPLGIPLYQGRQEGRPPKRSARDRTAVPRTTHSRCQVHHQGATFPLTGDLRLPERLAKLMMLTAIRIEVSLLCTTQHLYFIESRVVNNQTPSPTKNQEPRLWLFCCCSANSQASMASGFLAK